MSKASSESRLDSALCEASYPQCLQCDNEGNL